MLLQKRCEQASEKSTDDSTPKQDDGAVSDDVVYSTKMPKRCYLISYVDTSSLVQHSLSMKKMRGVATYIDLPVTALFRFYYIKRCGK